jgi:hypothetical protein
MALPEPKFESRTYRDLFNEAIARIPAHTPEWTNRAEPDPGITMLQLFSFMTESLLYRTNLIPERNRQKFLRLLQIPMRAAGAAEGLVSFSNPRGAFEIFTLNSNQNLAAGNVPFRSASGLAVLPIESRIYYKKPIQEAENSELSELYRNLYAAFDLPDNKLDFYESVIYEPATNGTTLRTIDLARESVDGTVWLALLSRSSETPELAREKIANSVLSLGLMPAVGDDGCSLYPTPPSAAENQVSLVFEIPNTSDDRIRYEPLEFIAEHDLLTQPGVVKLKIPGADKLAVWPEEPLTAGVDNRPPSLENSDDQDRLITWIRIRVPQVDTSKDISSRQLSVKLAWLGINAASIMQRTGVRAEKLTDGNGQPDQIIRLLNKPIIEDSLNLFVNGERWQEVDDLGVAPSELECHQSGHTSSSAIPATSKIYRLDLEAGEIYFGNGVHGARPPLGAVIQASYSHGGGLQGMVGIGTIQKSPALPSGVKVSNPVPTWGGAAAEKIADAERRIPQVLRHRDRLMSQDDFNDIILRTPGVNIGRVEVLPLFHPKLPRQTSAGVVTGVVIPLIDALHPNSPEPDQLFLRSVCAYLSPRRILTTELHIRGPEYQEVWVSVGIDVVPAFDPAPVRESVKKEVHRFLSALVGGFSAAGWPLEKAVDALEVSAAVTRVDGVSKVNQLRLSGATGPEVAEIVMEGLDLPRVMKVAVVEGDALTIEEIRGDNDAPSLTSDGTNIVPVPVVPSEC